MLTSQVLSGSLSSSLDWIQKLKHWGVFSSFSSLTILYSPGAHLSLAVFADIGKCLKTFFFVWTIERQRQGPVT